MRRALYLHGGLLDHSIFAAQIAGLAHLRVPIAPDLPGFGAAPPSKDPLALEALARVVLADIGGDDPLDVIGLSLGGGVAVAMARLAPARVRSLCLVGVGGAASGPPRAPAIKAQLAGGRVAAITDAFAARMLAPDNAHLTPAVRRLAAATSDDTILQLYELLDRYPPVLAWAEALAVPRLLVYGTHDGARAAAAASPLPCRLVAGAGHLVPLEAPEAFNALLAEFWASTPE